MFLNLNPSPVLRLALLELAGTCRRLDRHDPAPDLGAITRRADDLAHQVAGGAYGTIWLLVDDDAATRTTVRLAVEDFRASIGRHQSYGAASGPWRGRDVRWCEDADHLLAQVRACPARIAGQAPRLSARLPSSGPCSREGCP